MRKETLPDLLHEDSIALTPEPEDTRKLQPISLMNIYARILNKILYIKKHVAAYKKDCTPWPNDARFTVVKFRDKEAILAFSKREEHSLDTKGISLE